MSKSTGNFVEPMAFADQYGVDALRFFMIREMSVGQDSDFSLNQFLSRYNSELANNLGNLVNRTLNMTNRFSGGLVPAPDATSLALEPERELHALWEKTREEFITLCEGFQFHIALERAFAFVTATNRYVEQRAPWKLGKSTEAADQSLLRTSLATMAEALRLGASLLPAVMPTTTEKIYGVLGYTATGSWRERLVWDHRLTGAKVAETAILFPRPQAPETGAAKA
jgi:methionyl-tRNA synthetase